MFQLRFLGYLSAILVGTLIVFTGIEVIEFGVMGIVSGPLKWGGGLLILFFFGVFTAPVGLLGRYLCGMLPYDPLHVACTSGAVIALVLMPFIQPLITSATWDKNLLSFALVYLLAGTVGGYVWYRVEFRCRFLGAGA